MGGDPACMDCCTFVICHKEAEGGKEKEHNFIFRPFVMCGTFVFLSLYRIFIVAKLDTQFNWDVFHNEQFRESYSEAAKRVFESFKTNLGDSSPFQQVNPENIQRAYFIEPDFYRYPIDICDDVLYTLYILPGHEPAGLPVAIRLKD